MTTATTPPPAVTPVLPSGGDTVPMTDEQKFVFDMKGWLLVPGVLSAAECREMREFLNVFKHDRQSLPELDRFGYSGPIARLHDHPVAAGILRSIIAEDVNEKAYGFRLDGHYIQYRHQGDKGIEPHGGGPNPTPNFGYRCVDRRIYSGLTRVVWELNPVEKGKGGTLLMTGSHKASFHVPKQHHDQTSWLFETYACPEGSLLFFTENLCHSGATWLSETPRIAVFNCYTHHQCQYHKQNWNAEVIARWPAKRQSLVRGVWGADFNQNPTRLNDWYGPDNRAY